jgi:hypothetical protein
LAYAYIMNISANFFFAFLYESHEKTAINHCLRGITMKSGNEYSLVFNYKAFDC